MSEEIKEILDNWKYVIDNKITVYGETIAFKQIKLLLDYITNLQEENERLKEELQQEKKDFKEANDYCFELKDYKLRNEKAIEYIDKHLYMESTCGIQHPTFDGKPSYDFDCFELKNILNGGDDNE